MKDSDLMTLCQEEAEKFHIPGMTPDEVLHEALVLALEARRDGRPVRRHVQRGLERIKARARYHLGRTPSFTDISSEEVDMADQKPGPVDRAMTAEVWEIAAQCLSPAELQVIQMTRDGHSDEEIARNLDTTRNAVYCSRQRAIRKIREFFDRNSPPNLL